MYMFKISKPCLKSIVKKKVNGGNIITRRSNRSSFALPSRKSSNIHSSLKRPHILHPKVSTTTSKLAVSGKSSTKPNEEDDFMKTYILYTMHLVDPITELPV